MRFFGLHEGLYEGVQVRIEQLQAACEELNIEFCCLDTTHLDYSNLPKLGRGDLLYNFSRGSTFAEALLMNEQVTTFYIKNPSSPTDNSDTVRHTLVHSKQRLPQPKTIFNITTDRFLLEKYVKYLGGFPIIIKATGSTRGIGTIKIESWANLFSTVDFLVTTNQPCILRQFIKAEGVCRCRVLGERVIQAYEYPLLDKDFRNACVPFGQMPDIINRDFSEEIKQACVTAARLANTEYAAVDFIIDEQEHFYILEINSPPGLPLQWQKNGNTIALQMIQYLQEKSKTYD